MKKTVWVKVLLGVAIALSLFFSGSFMEMKAMFEGEVAEPVVSDKQTETLPQIKQMSFRVDSIVVVGELFNIILHVDFMGTQDEFPKNGFSLVWDKVNDKKVVEIYSALTSQYSNISILNGKKTKSVGFDWMLKLKAKEVGDFITPGYTLTYEGIKIPIKTERKKVTIMKGIPESGNDTTAKAQSGSVPAKNPSVKIKLRLDKAMVELGDTIHAECVVDCKNSLNSVNFKRPFEIEDCHVIERLRESFLHYDSIGNSLTCVLSRYDIIPLKTGSFVIPPIEIEGFEDVYDFEKDEWFGNMSKKTRVKFKAKSDNTKIKAVPGKNSEHSSYAPVSFRNEKTLKRKGWNVVLVDVSSDQDSPDAEGNTEMNLILNVLDNLVMKGLTPDSLTVFANGRLRVARKDFEKESKNDFKNLRYVIGDGTVISGALGSVLRDCSEYDRILLLTNGRSTEIPLAFKTLGKIARARNVTVDAVLTSVEAVPLKDSIGELEYSYSRMNVSDVDKTTKISGGKFVQITPDDNIAVKLNILTDELKKAEKVSSPKILNLDGVLVKKTLESMSPTSYYIIEVDTTQWLKWNGETLKGLNDIQNHLGASGSICVGMESVPYPSFDSEDRIYESRSYRNYIFAVDEEELKHKQAVLESLKKSSDLSKLSEATPYSLMPMVFYNGEGDTMKVCGFELVYDLLDVQEDIPDEGAIDERMESK